MASRIPFFSVIVPTFNRADLLAETLESIFSQKFTDFEILVVDDGSTDATLDYLRTLSDRVKILQQANRGAGAARNLGAKHAAGRYFAFLDSDDLWFPWTLATYRSVVDTCREPSFIVGKPHVFSQKASLTDVSQNSTKIIEFADYYSSGDEWRWWGASSFVIRADAFRSVGGFTEEWVNDEDTDLTLRLGTAPGFTQIVSPATFAYRKHEGSVSRDHSRLLTGTMSRVRNEREKRYPGGPARARERRRILTRHTRPVTLGCLTQGRLLEAWRLYLSTFVWNASLGRIKYLLAFPFLAMLSLFRQPSSGRL